MPLVVATGTTAPIPAAIPTPSYQPRYDDREGETYFYAGAASEDERKRGNSLGTVSGFRYFGERDGKHTIASVGDDEQSGLRYECSKPCRIIKRTLNGNMSRIPYVRSSVIGAAFEDALNGSLQIASRSSVGEPASASLLKTIPPSFVGEWNADLQACGTGANDSRLRIEPNRIRFYESDADVKRVNVVNQRAVRVSASFAGEGQVWTDEVEFVLSRSGSELSTGDVTRKRCPS